ncbi:hypothetical protein [Rhodospirillaceae bacterium SYSU D60014]|uniref:hypothetical protein n=1 Tax=Virgifigura deserti TaxID=2268457 RepID=UPI000E674A01
MTETGTTPQVTPGATIAELKDEIRRLSTLVDAVHRLFVEGQHIELGQLEARISACCSAASALPQASGAELQPALVALLDDLGRLDQKMRSRQSEIVERLGQTSMRRRAVAAYGGER